MRGKHHKRIIVLIGLVLSLISCERSLPQPKSKELVLQPREAKNGIQHLKYNPQQYGHQKSIYVPISYYQPIKDNTQSQLRLLVPLVYDADYGMVQPTTLNISGCDSLELDGQHLILYSQENSSVSSVTPQPQSSPLAVYDTTTVVMIVYSDSTMQIIPNWRLVPSWIQVPQQPIDGLLFLTTDHLNF